MVNNPLFSIVIPFKINEISFFNDLISCLNDYNGSLCEFVFIDDCSDEKISSIAESRIKTIPNSLYFKNEENHGVSYSRNLGIDKAKGKYILFVDSDDLIDCRFLNVLPDMVGRLSSDSLLCLKMDYFNRTDELVYEKINCATETVKIASDAINHYLYFDSNLGPYMFKSACGKLFLKEVIQSNNIRFSENLNHYEDSLFVAEYCKSINKVVLVDSNTFYFYRKNDASASRTYDEKLVDQISTYFTFFKTKCQCFYETLVFDTLFLFVPYLIANSSNKRKTLTNKDIRMIFNTPFVSESASYFRKTKVKDCINTYLVRLNKLMKMTPKFIWIRYINHVSNKYLLK